jgi:hypothetical protein
VDDVILTIRGHKVILDADLAHIYGVETKNLSKACRRNLLRFPEDFVFRLTADKVARLRFQNGTSNPCSCRLRNPPLLSPSGQAPGRVGVRLDSHVGSRVGF